MKTKSLAAAALAAAMLFGCKSMNRSMDEMIHPEDVYAKPMFYEKYLNPADPNDARIEQTLNMVRANPKSAPLHNDLGQMLRAKGFPKDAETEFERAVNVDSSFYPAWYNLGLMRQDRGNDIGAKIAFGRVVHYKPGHAAALFQLGLIEERDQHTEAAIEDYAKAIGINHELLDVRVNPRVLDSHLIDLALLRLYPAEHARESLQFQRGLDATYTAPPAPSTPPAAASPQVPAKNIVTPAAPVTSPATQTPPPNRPPAE